MNHSTSISSDKQCYQSSIDLNYTNPSRPSLFFMTQHHPTFWIQSRKQILLARLRQHRLMTSRLGWVRPVSIPEKPFR